MGRSDSTAQARLRSNNRMGVIIPHNKATAELETVEMPLPSQVILPMQMHIGAQCVPLVKRKDHVDVGQLVGHAEARTTADIFSPVSGTVKELRTIYYSNGRNDVAIVIEPDGEQTVAETVKPPVVTDYASLVAAVKASGLVGLGGAGYPTGLKMDTDLSSVDCWLVNGAECEPYLSSDYREMVERPQDLIDGIKLCLDLSGVPRSLICIEDNKPKAIELLRKMAADDPRIQVLELPARYPQGASRVILKNAMGRAVPRGGHLTDVGAILFNCTTMGEIARYVRTGMPLIQRRITVMGDAIANPQNLMVYVGTPTGEILDFCGLSCEPAKVISGGPMMGATQVDMDYPVMRQQSGLLAFSEAMCAVHETTACIHCDKCISSCPMRLSPVNIQKAYRKGDVAELDRLMADLCVGCGICSYVCPAKQPLTQSVGLAGKLLKAEKRKAKGRG